MISVKQVEVCLTDVLMIALGVYYNQALQVTNIGHTEAINREPNEFVKLKWASFKRLLSNLF